MYVSALVLNVTHFIDHSSHCTHTHACVESLLSKTLHSLTYRSVLLRNKVFQYLLTETLWNNDRPPRCFEHVLHIHTVDCWLSTEWKDFLFGLSATKNKFSMITNPNRWTFGKNEECATNFRVFTPSLLFKFQMQCTHPSFNFYILNQSLVILICTINIHIIDTRLVYCESRPLSTEYFQLPYYYYYYYYYYINTFILVQALLHLYRISYIYI